MEKTECFFLGQIVTILEENLEEEEREGEEGEGVEHQGKSFFLF